MKVNVGLSVLLLLVLVSCSRQALESSESLETFLMDNGFEYHLDEEGDYQIDSDGQFLIRDVWIRGSINYSGDVGIREIFSLSSRLGSSELNQVSTILLMDNVQTRVMGSWSLLKDNNNNGIILYTVKAPLNAEDEFILQAIKEVSEAATTLDKVLFPGS